MFEVPAWLRRGAAIPSWEEMAERVKQLEDTNRHLLEQARLDKIKSDGGKAELSEELGVLRDWMETVARQVVEDVPAIAQQSPWPCQLYNLGKAEADDQTRFFNCGLMDFQGSRWLVARRARSWEKFRWGMNDMVAFQLKDDQAVVGKVLTFPRRYAEEHFEDPRVSVMAGKHWLSCTNFQIMTSRKGWTGCHQVIGELGENWHLPRLYDPVYGHNAASLYMTGGHNEKNWLWFEYLGAPYLVYSTVPHEVIRFDWSFEKREIHTSSFSNPLWTHGLQRGGTPPVLVDGEYWSFFHSSMPWVGHKRRYHMGVYAFEGKPPFQITRMSSLPILSGSKNDPWVEGLPLVVFPCGALFNDGVWHVTLGVNDCKCAWIRIPHNELVLTTRKAQDVKVAKTTVHESQTTVSTDNASRSNPDERRVAGEQGRGGGNGEAPGSAGNADRPGDHAQRDPNPDGAVATVRQ